MTPPTEKEVRTFVIAPGFIRLTSWASWLCAAFAVLFSFLPLLPPDEKTSQGVIYFIVALGVSLFGTFAALGFQLCKKMPSHSVSMDSEGLWPAHLAKEEGLIRWEEIASTKERPVGQRLDLLDAQGKVLLKLEYQLAGFEDLRGLVEEKTRRFQEFPTSLEFKKPAAYHALMSCLILGSVALGLTLLLKSQSASFIVAVFGCVGLIGGPWFLGRDYLTSVCRVKMHPTHLEIQFPFRKEMINRQHIEKIEISDEFYRGNRIQIVHLFVAGKEAPLRLEFGDALPVYQALKKWESA